MATVDELVTRIKSRLSRLQDTSVGDRILTELVAAQETLELAPTLPWFLSVRDEYIVNGAHDTFWITAFPGFIRITDDDYGMRVENPALEEPMIKLVKQDTYEQLRRYSSGVADESTYPEAYCILGTVVHIRKKQVVGRKYKLSYFQKDPIALALGVTNKWTTYAPELLAATAGIEVARYLRDDAAVKYFSGMEAKQRMALFKFNQAHQDADQSYVMGD